MDENVIFPQPVGRERIQELNQILQKYKSGKAQDNYYKSLKLTLTEDNKLLYNYQINQDTFGQNADWKLEADMENKGHGITWNPSVQNPPNRHGRTS